MMRYRRETNKQISRLRYTNGNGWWGYAKMKRQLIFTYRMYIIIYTCTKSFVTAKNTIQGQVIKIEKAPGPRILR